MQCLRRGKGFSIAVTCADTNLALALAGRHVTFGVLIDRQVTQHVCQRKEPGLSSHLKNPKFAKARPRTQAGSVVLSQPIDMPGDHVGTAVAVDAIRVLIADDHTMVRQGMKSLLQSSEGFEVVGEAEDGREAVARAEKLLPDVALIDVRMTGFNGIDATRELLAVSPETNVLAISAHDDAGAIESMFQAGARGYILKDTPVREMLNAISSVANGEYYLCKPILGRVIESLVLNETERESRMFSVLTPREREVAQLLSEGLSTRQIAKRLSLSVKTIDTHRYQVLKKLNLRGIADLTRLALREGLSSLDD